MERDQNMMLFVILCFVVGLHACAPTSIKHSVIAPSPQNQKFDELIIGNIVGGELSSEDQGILPQTILKGLTERKTFPSVVLGSEARPPKETSLTLTGRISEVDEGSEALRFFVGFGAGASEVTGNFQLSSYDGKVLLSFVGSTSYAGGAGIGGADLVSSKDMLERLGDAVVDDVDRWSKGLPLENGEG